MSRSPAGPLRRSLTGLLAFLLAAPPQAAAQVVSVQAAATGGMPVSPVPALGAEGASLAPAPMLSAGLGSTLPSGAPPIVAPRPEPVAVPHTNAVPAAAPAMTAEPMILPAAAGDAARRTVSQTLVPGPAAAAALAATPAAAGPRAAVAAHSIEAVVRPPARAAAAALVRLQASAPIAETLRRGAEPGTPAAAAGLKILFDAERRRGSQDSGETPDAAGAARPGDPSARRRPLLELMPSGLAGSAPPETPAAARPSASPGALPAPAPLPVQVAPAQARSRLATLLTLAGRFTGLHPLWLLLRDGVQVSRVAADLLDPETPADRRLLAANRLGALSRPDTIPALGWAMANDPDPWVRGAAAGALGRLAVEWTPVLVAELKLSSRPSRRAGAARRLGWLARHAPDPAAIEALVDEAAMDVSSEARLAAIDALGNAGGARAVEALEWMRKGASDAHLRSALELAAAAARTQTLLPLGYRPPAGEFEQSKSPLYMSALKTVIAVGAFFLGVELVGSILTGSLALRADAMHMAADLAVSIGALFSVWVSRRPPTSRKTFGYLKMEAMMGLLSSVVIALTAVEIGWEAFHRLLEPVAVPGLTTLLVALAGLSSNIIATVTLRKHSKDNLSLKGAFLHAATDALGSVGIIVSGLLILGFGWYWADPLISFVILALIAHTAWELAARSWNVLMDAVPEGVDLDELESELLGLDGVAAASDLHVWALNSSETVMTGRLYLKPGADPVAGLRRAETLLREKHGIRHTTIQVEPLPKTI